MDIQYKFIKMYLYTKISCVNLFIRLNSLYELHNLHRGDEYLENYYSNKNSAIYFLLLIVPLFWGGAFVVTKHVVTELPAFASATLRYAPSGIILAVILFLRKDWNFKVIKKHWLGLTCMSITGIFSYNALCYIGLVYTSSINGSLIIAATPVLITISSVLFFKESWNKYMVIGLILSFVGVLIVTTKGSLPILLSLSFNKGDIIFIGALISWVIHGLIGKVVLQEVTSLQTTTITMIIGSTLLGICSVFEKGWGNILTLSTQSWLELIYMVVFATIIAFFLWNKGIQKIGASKSSIYMNLVPINAAWISVVLYGSKINIPQLIGIGVVLLGVYFSTSGTKLENKIPEKNLIYEKN